MKTKAILTAKEKSQKTAKRQRALQMRVMDDASKEPMAMVNVQINSVAKDGTDLTKTVKKSGDKGGIVLNNLAAGEYTYIANFGGYTEERGTFFVNEGVMTEVKVIMKRNGIG